MGGGGDTPFIKPNVSHCIGENHVHYNPRTWADEYLTFVALEDGTFTFTPASGNAISYSIDNGDSWIDLAADTNTPTVTRGNKVLWRGEMTPTSDNGVGTFSSTGRFEAQGNAMSLLFGDEFKGKTDLTGKDYAFVYLFNSNSNLVNAQNLSLPATTLASYCYQYMFYGCTSLVTAPKLPATTLADYCYSEMFNGCTGLTSAPSVLPATTLADSCYYFMFNDCTSLVTAPKLPATTLAQDCYNSMFYGCTSLVTAPTLPATILLSNCYYYMFNDCTSLANAPVLSATTLATSCYSNMFRGCTNLVTAPELPATTLANSCYSNMFRGCTNLVTAPELPATTLERYCYNGMFNGCSSLNYIKAVFTTEPSSSYTRDWVSGVASTGTFVKNSAATWDVTGVNGIPEGWTKQTATV